MKSFLAGLFFCLISITGQAQYSYSFKTEYNYSNHYANPGYTSTNLNLSGMGSTMQRMQEENSNSSSGTMRPMTDDERNLLKLLFGLIGVVFIVLFGSLFFYNRSGEKESK